MDGADVGMIKDRGGFGFALEAGQHLRVFRYIVREELKGDKPTQLHIIGLVDDAHPTTA
jgi:hypothetical protein